MQPEVSFFNLLGRVRGLTTKAKMVYLWLYYAERESRPILGQEAMARDLGLSLDSVNRGLRELRDKNYVSFKHRGLTLPGIYSLIDPVPPPTEPAE